VRCLSARPSELSRPSLAVSYVFCRYCSTADGVLSVDVQQSGGLTYTPLLHFRRFFILKVTCRLIYMGIYGKCYTEIYGLKYLTFVHPLCVLCIAKQTILPACMQVLPRYASTDSTVSLAVNC